MEKYNDGIKKEIMLVWDEGMGEHRYATEQEKLNPDIAKLCANKRGSYINKEADSMVRPDNIGAANQHRPNRYQLPSSGKHSTTSKTNRRRGI